MMRARRARPSDTPFNCDLSRSWFVEAGDEPQERALAAAAAANNGQELPSGDMKIDAIEKTVFAPNAFLTPRNISDAPAAGRLE